MMLGGSILSTTSAGSQSVPRPVTSEEVGPAVVVPENLYVDFRERPAVSENNFRIELVET